MRQVNVRFPAEVLDKLEAWRAELNGDRRVALTQSDMIRGIVDWATDEQPDWEQKATGGRRRTRR